MRAKIPDGNDIPDYFTVNIRDMTDTARDLLERVLALPVQERAEVAARVLESLDESHDDPAAVERAWREEIGRRVREIREGKVKAIPADEVFAHARELLARSRRPT